LVHRKKYNKKDERIKSGTSYGKKRKTFKKSAEITILK
jgi:hypothetical protein